jgi:uncharacterized protein
MISQLSGLGIGHLPVLHENILNNRALFDFVEITPESYIGGDSILMEEQISETKKALPITCHGIDLSLCSVEPPEDEHLNSTLAILHSCEPVFFSEHLAYTKSEELNADIYFPPIYVEEELKRIADRCKLVSSRLARPLHLENVPDFLFGKSGMGEGAFFKQLADMTTSGIILNIDSITISAKLQKLSVEQLIDSYPLDRIVSLTVVPESCMNPIIGRMCGGFDVEMLDAVEYCLKKSSAKSVLVQTRYEHNTPENLSLILESIRQKLRSQLQ